jgi:hypothetical protein
MKVQAFIFLFIITTFFSSESCKDKLNSTMSNSQKTAKNIDNGKTLDITSGIKIEMAEALDSAKRVLKFNCSTNQCYDHLSNTFNISTNNITIGFSSIYVPSICATQPGPAKTIIPIGTLSDGTYNLTIKIGGNKTTGKLNVTTGQYKITIDTSDRIKISSPVLYRVPKNTIWGGIGYQTKQSDSLVQSFIDSLKFYGAVSQTLQVGTYGHFVIDSTGQIIRKNHGYYFYRPFIFNYSNNISILTRLVNDYGNKRSSIINNFSPIMSIWLYNSQGDQLRSWTKRK